MLIRPMTAQDVPAMVTAFAALGWPGKGPDLYHRYIARQSAGECRTYFAEYDGGFAGYVVVVWRSPYPPFAQAGIPEITDLNVLPGHRRRGIGNALLSAAEATIAERAEVAGLGVGLYADYGAAQRIYARRGYVPDGRGVMYDNEPVPPGATIRLDDDATLMMTKTLMMKKH
jgi:GNAT superfamily N-acetyltransferase